jgi:hypothetical protein
MDPIIEEMLNQSCTCENSATGTTEYVNPVTDTCPIPRNRSMSQVYDCSGMSQSSCDKKDLPDNSATNTATTTPLSRKRTIDDLYDCSGVKFTDCSGNNGIEEDEELEEEEEEDSEEDHVTMEEVFSSLPASARTIVLEGSNQNSDLYMSGYIRDNHSYIRINGYELLYTEFQQCLHVLQNEFKAQDCMDWTSRNRDEIEELEQKRSNELQTIIQITMFGSFFMMAGIYTWVVFLIEGLYN